MAIYGIEGGIGTGKTLSGVCLLIQDLKEGKTIYTNVKLKNLPSKYKKKIIYLTKENIQEIFQKIRNKEWSMKNSTVFIQEAHNYMDSRNSATAQNKLLSYWILQSRHTGEGSCDIIYDTQELTQVDIRLRRNTDYTLRPVIAAWETIKGKKKPATIIIHGEAKIGHAYRTFTFQLDVSETRDQYDTHQIVDF